MDILKSFSTQIINLIDGILKSFPTFTSFYKDISRWIFLLLAIFILVRAIRSLLSYKVASEVWGYLSIEGEINIPITHWENVIGRAKSSDITLDLKSVSRTHSTLIRKDDGNWYYKDLNSKSGSFINGIPCNEEHIVNFGDKIDIGGITCTLLPTSVEEDTLNDIKRSKSTNIFTPWRSLIALTLFQFLLVIQFIIVKGSELSPLIPLGIFFLTILMWVYHIVVRSIGMVYFEIETIAFFLSTLGLSVVATSSPNEMLKQFLTIFIGIFLFFGLCIFLRDLNRAMKYRKYLVVGSILLLLINILFGTLKYGAINWVRIGGFSVQPSELIKVAFILIGSATLDELFQKKNLTLFLFFSIFCLGSFAYMGDFGTAAIFFITFLVISFLRSGDFSKLALMIGSAAAGGMLVLRFKPYILGRFNTWLNAWDFADAGGYQQVRTMSAGASGGLLGLGAGTGWLKKVGAADTDLVFGIICEEWGLIIAVLSVLCIISFGLFAFISIKSGRSTFYTIAACGATTLLTFQTILNVFGAVDILPLTGVTFPFVSNGGTSMIVSWGMLAFIKSSDIRPHASLAVPSKKSKGVEYE